MSEFLRAGEYGQINYVEQVDTTFNLVDTTAPDWTCWVTHTQTAGRGRLDRVWVTPPASSLLVCILVPATANPTVWPLAAGYAVMRAVNEVLAGEVADGAGIAYEARVSASKAQVKWPNDVHVDGLKICGILSELRGDKAVLGIGVNITQARSELLETATSLRDLGVLGEVGEISDILLASILRRLREYPALLESIGAPTLAGEMYGTLLGEITDSCVSIGKNVRVLLPGGADLQGVATGLGLHGELLVENADGAHKISAGDIIHLR